MNKDLNNLAEKYNFLFLDYINNYISIEYFAICNKIKIRKAKHIINTGKIINNNLTGLN